jgi:hypothetical protein
MHKRFVCVMACKNAAVYVLTDRRRACLWAIAWSWRKQLLDDLVEVARRGSGERGINSGQNPPELSRAAPRKKRTPRPKPAQPENAGALLVFEHEFSRRTLRPRVAGKTSYESGADAR